MIIYKDVLTGDELISDTYPIKDVGDGLWEVDGKMITKGAENFTLEGANPSAEGEDAEEGGEGETTRVLDLADGFRLNYMESKPDKKAFTGDMKRYLKKVSEKLKEKGESADNIKAFQSGAAAAIKKILGNYDNYDLYMGESMEPEAMYVLVDFREDGITPYATYWKWGMEEMKV